MESDRVFSLDSFKDISLLTLGKPNPLPGGGSYYAKLLYNNNPIDIQAPACLTKQGIINTGSKTYCDLMYDNKEPIEPSLIQVLEQIEEKCIQLIFDKRNTWFSSPLELSDIETAFTSCLRLYKSGKYTLVRTNIPTSKKTIKTNNQTCEVYNQKGDNLTLESITPENKIIPLIRIDELRFTSKSFHINITLNQCLILDKVDETKKGCRIKINSQESDIFESKELTQTYKLDETLEKVGKTKALDSTIPILKETREDNIKKQEIINKPINLINVNTNKDLTNNKKSNSEELEEVDIVPENETESDEESQNDSENELQELNIEVNDSEDEEFDGMKVIKDFKVDKQATTLKLKKPDEVYYELYKKAKEKAKQARKEAIALFLEAKNIKAKYMLDEIDESDDEEFYSEI